MFRIVIRYVNIPLSQTYRSDLHGIPWVMTLCNREAAFRRDILPLILGFAPPGATWYLARST
jgi:hypothetical protein